MDMRRLMAAALLGLVLLAGACSAPAGPSGPSERGIRGPGANARPAAGEPVSARVQETLARLPLAFEPDPTAAAGTSQFRAAASGYGVVLSDGGDALVRTPPADGTREGASEFGMRLTGGAARPPGRGSDPLPGKRNFLVGPDRANWRTDVQTYGAVVYDGVYPGVDLVYHGGQGPERPDGAGSTGPERPHGAGTTAQQLEYDFVLAPGVDAGVIDVALDGVESFVLESGGALVLHLPGGAELRMDPPVMYQEVAGARRPVSGGFVLRGADRVGFSVGPHDTTRPLVIDPVLVSSTFLGGGGVDSCYGITVDASGSIYVTGYTESTDFPTAVPIQPTLSQTTGVRTDAFVAKLDRSGTTLLFATFLGGGGRDTGYAIALGPDGGVFVTGSTESVDFPAFGSVQPAFGGGASDAFLVKMNPTGTSLQYATTIGGTGIDGARGLAVDIGGNAIVTGSTTSPDFPTVAPVQAQLGGQTDAFVFKLQPTGLAFVYSTYLGGSADEHGLGVATDGVGDAYVTGDTSSPNFPTMKPLQARYGGTGAPDARGSDVAGDAFLSRLDRAGSSYVFSTYLGGSDSDGAAGVAVDNRGNIYLTGTTGSSNFPLVKPHQPRKAGEFDAFVVEVPPGAASLTYSTYLGGSSSEGGTAIAVDTKGRASVGGATASSDFPVTKAIQAAKSGGFVDGFLTTMSAGGADLDVSTYVGGGDEDQVTAVSLDGDGIVHLAGYTNSGDFPVERALRPAKAGPAGDAFVLRVDELAGSGSGGTAGTGAGRDNRVRILIGTTIALLLAAVVMTVWLRRHPTPAGAGSAGPVGPGGARVPPPRPREDKVFPSLQPVAPKAKGQPAKKALFLKGSQSAKQGQAAKEAKPTDQPAKKEPAAKPAAPAKQGPTVAPKPTIVPTPDLPAKAGASGPGPVTGQATPPMVPAGGEVPGAEERPVPAATPSAHGGGPGGHADKPGGAPPKSEAEYDRWFEYLVSDDAGAPAAGPSGPSERGVQGPAAPAQDAGSEWWEVGTGAGLPTGDRPAVPDAELPAPELGEHEMAAWELLISAPAPAPGPERPIRAGDTGPAGQEPSTGDAGRAPEDSSSPGRTEGPPKKAGGDEVSDLWSEDLPISQSPGDAAREDWLRTLWAEDLPVPDQEGPSGPAERGTQTAADTGGTPPEPPRREGPEGKGEGEGKGDARPDR